jgi:hypothetical protein
MRKTRCPLTKKHDLREQKYAPIAKNRWMDGLNQFLGHVSPTLDNASDPSGHRDTWVRKIIFSELLVALAALVAQAFSHSSSCGFLLPSPNSSIFCHQKFLVPLFYFDQASCKKIQTQKRCDIMAFHGGHCMLAVKINPPTCKYAFLWSKKRIEPKKQHSKLLLKIIFLAMTRF